MLADLDLAAAASAGAGDPTTTATPAQVNPAGASGSGSAAGGSSGAPGGEFVYTKHDMNIFARTDAVKKLALLLPDLEEKLIFSNDTIIAVLFACKNNVNKAADTLLDLKERESMEYAVMTERQRSTSKAQLESRRMKQSDFETVMENGLKKKKVGGEAAANVFDLTHLRHKTTLQILNPELNGFCLIRCLIEIGALILPNGTNAIYLTEEAKSIFGMDVVRAATVIAYNEYQATDDGIIDVEIEEFEECSGQERARKWFLQFQRDWVPKSQTTKVYCNERLIRILLSLCSDANVTVHVIDSSLHPDNIYQEQVYMTQVQQYIFKGREDMCHIALFRNYVHYGYLSN